MTVLVDENEEEEMKAKLDSVTKESILAEMQRVGGCYGDAQKWKQVCAVFEDIGGDPNRDYSDSDSSTESTTMTKELVAIIVLMSTNLVTFIALVWTCILLCRR